MKDEEVKTSSSINPKELVLEKGRLKHTLKEIRSQLSEMGSELMEKESQATEFKKYIWDSKQGMDAWELKSVMAESEKDVFLLQQKGIYFKKLYQIQANPYFGSIIFEDEEHNKELVYIGITHVIEGDFVHLVNDWRSPICSLFYDYETGPCAYDSPGGIMKGRLLRKRQYKISDSRLIHVFDNSINVDDELLQSVLSSESSDRMRNIVNTIQQEQNRIIRNVTDTNLIVQGIAGSGKTSVALHRIAFLLYKIKNLSSQNILIFSPNNVFTEYISNVLPELGEDNTMQTTFNDFIHACIKDEYNDCETFVDFIARYYQKSDNNVELIIYKQSDEIIEDIDKFINGITSCVKFKDDIKMDEFYVSAAELNEMFTEKYSKLPIFNRLEEIATRLSERKCNGKLTKKAAFLKKLKESFNLPINIKKIYASFYKSKLCRVDVTETEIKDFVMTDKISYEDSVLFCYFKGLLTGFDYNNNIKQVVIDEAQDYSKIQYLILSKIFKNSGLTILGDVNQTINPYYKYQTLEILSELFKGKTSYLELTKTYRSSQEIIEYSNNVLGLKHVNAIRESNNLPVLNRIEDDLKYQLLDDIKYLQFKYKSVAIITKDDVEADLINNLIKDDIHIERVTQNTEKFEKDLIVIPSYMAKGLEFDSVIVYNKKNNVYKDNERNLFYVAVTRAQHELIVYNN